MIGDGEDIRNLVMPSGLVDMATRFIDLGNESQNGYSIIAVQAQDAFYRPATFFVKVVPENKAVLLEALQCNAGIDLTQYGEIVAACYGETLDENARQILHERFGKRDDHEETGQGMFD